ncbi:putative spore germination protein GerPB [compost metagenome]
MNLTIHQSIMIQHLRVDAVSNSSVLQIGTAGAISALSNQYNTGGFTTTAPELKNETSPFGPGTEEIPPSPVSLVPLPKPD